MATKYSALLAEGFHLSRYTVGFIVVAFISILPETFIAINSAIQGVPEFGLGTLFGSNVADLTLIFAILIFHAGRSIKIESKVMKDVRLFPFFILLPLIFGLNGHYSRTEGVALIVVGALFYYLVFKDGIESSQTPAESKYKFRNLFGLASSMALLLIGSHFSVASAGVLAQALEVSPILIGLLIVSLGTTMPELFYSLKSVEKKDDDLAIGDVMGSVLADATIVVGIIALINPFYFPTKIIYVTGSFMIIASLVLMKFMESGHAISRREGYMLLTFWLFYGMIEILVNG